MALSGDITFYKYHGAGNDFILIDNRDGHFDQYSDDRAFIQWLCDRNFGVGADGVLEVRAHPQCDFEMVYTREEGVKGPYLCGNGSRCAVAFSHFLGVHRVGEKFNFMARDGPHVGWVDEETEDVFIQFNSVREIKKYDEENYFIDVGNERHVTFVENLWDYDTAGVGVRISRDPRYETSGGMNVMFIQVESDGQLSVRSLESKVDYEPLACGTGSVASALVYESTKPWQTSSKPEVQRTEVICKGGKLSVSFERTGTTEFQNIHLIGPAKRVFKGEVNYEAYLANPKSKYSKK